MFYRRNKRHRRGQQTNAPSSEQNASSHRNAATATLICSTSKKKKQAKQAHAVDPRRIEYLMCLQRTTSVSVHLEYRCKRHAHANHGDNYCQALRLSISAGALADVRVTRYTEGPAGSPLKKPEKSKACLRTYAAVGSPIRSLAHYSLLQKAKFSPAPHCLHDIGCKVYATGLAPIRPTLLLWEIWPRTLYRRAEASILATPTI